MTPEFSRPERIDAIGERARTVAIEAGEGERAALAERFGLVSIESLAAELTLRREAAGIAARGRVTAEVVQACVVTDAPVPARIDEDVALLFVPEGGEGDEEIELSAEDLDVVPYAGGAIDLGEAAAETMALALDPFPRAPDAEAALRAAGVLTEEEAKPAGALAGLKDALERKR
ncbi:MAG TPA: DUF177 domain-containing protein [Sphingomonas sp.]|nr:DUF177 domain-containing protein [Sphingomonas sp.]